METKELLEQFVKQRDNSVKIIAAFGYGSGVFKQTGYKLQEKPMIDTIFVVDNPRLWHKENMKKNPDDYSLSGKIILKFFDINAIKNATGVTYQSNIQFMDSTFKYGVIGREKFIEAMHGNWNNFFIQGRFQKPVYTIRSTEEIDDAIKKNRELAIFIALITLKKDKPTLTDLYYQICSLSYKGDIRMLFAENPNKIYNIVNGSFQQFVEMYGTENEYFYTKDNGELVINKDLIYQSLSLLPERLYAYLQHKGFSIIQSNDIAKLLEQKISSVNRKDSIIQPLTGILTVGPVQSLSYFKKKLKKKTMKS